MNDDAVLRPLSLSERFSTYKRMLFEIAYLIMHNVFVLVNIIIFGVVGLLIYFGDVREGLSLAFIISLNISLGIIQDINAWVVLERLQKLTALNVKRITHDKKYEVVSPEALAKGDRILLTLGDSIPCDSILIESNEMEVSEAVITGESSSTPRAKDAPLLAGSVVTAGSGIAEIETVFRKSRIAKMTAQIKRYKKDESPIQRTINSVVTYTGYLLIAVIIFIVIHGSATGTEWLNTIKTIGALSAVLVPQGLVVAVTLLFAFGGIHFYRRHVLLREVNATEKLARIKNLCVDKTGTLTENTLSVEKIIIPKGVEQTHAEDITRTYVNTSDTSELMQALKRFLGESQSIYKSIAHIPFSSWRQYGGALIQKNAETHAVLAGTPEVFTPHMTVDDRKWMAQIITKEAAASKRVFCLVQTDTREIPKDLNDSSLTPLAVFVLENKLRDGTRETIDFFQKRGVRIRVLSGDNTETIQAVSRISGIKNTEAMITGEEMNNWTQGDYDEKAKEYTIFARIVPEQKEHIIDALKKDGFTGMIGDGANDALAIKKADLGIAMFDGTPATRQVASVVLLHNSFTELPNGVRLADSIIENLYIFGAVFINQTAIGLFLYIFLTIFGHNFPFSPLNIAFTSYFAIGIPNMLIGYWAIRPAGEVGKTGSESFLRKVFPYSIVSGAFSAIALTFIMNIAVTTHAFTTAQSTTLGVLAYAFFGYLFFVLAPFAYSTAKRPARIQEILGIGLAEILIAICVFAIAPIRSFFDLTTIPLSALTLLAPTALAYLIIQYSLARIFLRYTR